MEKTFDPKIAEKKIYDMWESGGYFKAQIDPTKKPFTIVLPPPNASGKMHTGNVLMIAIEDLLIRWKRMQGYSALWVPGTDHAGFETQITFERELKKQGKSRFDFDRQSFYDAIWEFVQNNKSQIEGQIKQMGASVDWSRYTFTLDPHVINTVYSTFEKMHKEGLIYRGDYIVNYCPVCGTTFADLEIDFVERNDPLYYIKYKLASSSSDEFVTVATVRPETIYADMFLAVNPKDEAKKHLVGQKVINPLTGAQIDIISDPFVDPEFGTGIVKITPAHDKNDYEAALRHGLSMEKGVPTAVDWSGRMTALAGDQLKGKKVKEARKLVLEILTQSGMIDHIDEKYIHMVSTCYKGGHDIEPTILANWFVRVDAQGKSFKKPALDAVVNGDVKIYPKWREITYTKWMEDMRDWPISRQVVWGIRIPVWYKADDVHAESLWVSWIDKDKVVHSNTLKTFINNGVLFEEIEKGLQRVVAPAGSSEFVISKDKPQDGLRYLPETDTFDTWFSSGQWPLVTLKYPESKDYEYFYPTAVLETGWEIIRLWVSRMIMFGIYLTGRAPFKDVYLHGIVRALDGKKMSKSLGNVINPDEYIEKYGVDALRMGLISGTANGKDFAFPKDKVIAYRNFANKIWNMARFMLMMTEKLGKEVPFYNEAIASHQTARDADVLGQLNTLITTVNENLEKYRFSDAADAIYHFMWDELAAKYLEELKDRQDLEVGLSVFKHVFLTCLKLLHPFMPFVTEEIWGSLPRLTDKPLIISTWPIAK